VTWVRRMKLYFVTVREAGHVHRYPAKVKAFYMEPIPATRPGLCVDVLAPEGHGESSADRRRMASYDLLVQRIHEHGFPKKLSVVLDLRNSAACARRLRQWESNASWGGSAAGACAGNHSFPRMLIGCIRRVFVAGLRNPSVRQKRPGGTIDSSPAFPRG